VVLHQNILGPLGVKYLNVFIIYFKCVYKVFQIYL
jgi:hypothetical protein